MQGDFSAGTFPQWKYRLEKIMKGSLALQREPAQRAFIDTLIERDNSTVERMWNDARNKCLGFKVTWMKETPVSATRSQTTNLFDPVCDFEGEEGEATSQNFEGLQHFEAEVKVADDNCPNLFEKAEKIAERHAEAKKSIINAINAYYAAKLNSYAGVQKYTASDNINIATTANAGLLSKVNPGNINHVDFSAYMNFVKVINRYGDLKVLDGQAFAKFLNTANILDGSLSKDEHQKMLSSYLGAYESAPLDFITNSLSSNFFLIQKGVIATAFHNSHPDTPTQRNANNGINRLLYTEPLGINDRYGNPIMCDVSYKETEGANPDDKTCNLWHNWHFRVWAEAYQNPLSGDGRTGVLKYLVDGTVTKLTNPYFPTYS
jgi:hypothetical protein